MPLFVGGGSLNDASVVLHKGSNFKTISTWSSHGNFTNFVDPANSANWIWDIQLSNTLGIDQGGFIEYVISNNPNGGGSGAYRTIATGYVALSTTWHGNGYTPLISSDTVVYNGSSGTINAFIYHNASTSGGGITGEYETSLSTAQAGSGRSLFWGSSGITLRFRLTGGFNSTYPGVKNLTITAFGVD